jgi:Saxitoxin biosynthesis operon protein SxtJ
LHSKNAAQTHESFEREEEIHSSSERVFGLVFGVVFMLVGLWPLWQAAAPRWWSLAVGGMFVALGLVLPQALSPINYLWFKFGLVLHAIVNPIVMALLFFTTVTPIALIMRAAGKDPLRLKFDPDAPTYWITRTPPGPVPETMPRQF